MSIPFLPPAPAVGLVDPEQQPQAVQALVQWVVRNVPSFVGPVPPDWTHAVIARLKQAGVQLPHITLILATAQNHGHNFGIARPEVLARKPSNMPVRDWKPRSTEGWNVAQFGEFVGVLESRYLKAKMSGDVAGMELVIVAILKVLWEVLKAQQEIRGEREKWEQVHQAVRSRAPNIAGEIRHLTPQQLRDLRAAPTPGDLTRLRIRLRMPASTARVRRVR
jgi:hypothetical protein